MKLYKCKEKNTTSAKARYSLLYFMKLYWRNSNKTTLIFLILTLFVVSSIQVFSMVALNKWQNYFFDALQTYNANRLIHAFILFFVIALVFSIAVALISYLSGLISLKWRKQLTEHFSKAWLSQHNYHRLQANKKIDNPEQRISDDMANLPSLTVQIAVQVFQALLTLVSFSLILWKLSEQWAMNISGTLYHLPGVYFYSTIIYALIFNILIFTIGHKLINLNYTNQAFTANFRFNMSLVREHSDHVGLQKLEKYYSRKLSHNFSKIFFNSLSILKLDRWISFSRNIYMICTMPILLLIALPAYFVGHLSIGYIMQVGTAGASLNAAFAVLILAYENIAQLRAAHLRVSELESELTMLNKASHKQQKSILLQEEPVISLSNATLYSSEAQPLLTIGQLMLTPEKNHLIIGDNNPAKLALLRSLAGHHHDFTGNLQLPKDFDYSFIAQTIFLPDDKLLNILYLHNEEEPNIDLAADALTRVGLAHFVPELTQKKAWQKLLSTSEKQQLALAQAILKQPTYLFVDGTHLLNDDIVSTSFTKIIKENFILTTVIVIANKVQEGDLFDEIINIDKLA